MADTTGSADEAETGEGAEARRWFSALDDCDKWRADYLTRCKRIIRRYRNERAMGANTAPSASNRQYAILWSNVQTLGPAVYARTPSPVVTRRYKDSDPTGRFASEVLERALTFSMDQYEFDDHIKLARDDFLLLAQGQIWVRYVPHESMDDARETGGDDIEDEGPSVTNTAEVEEPAGEAPYAETVCDHVAFDDWGMERCRSWDETGYVWRRVYMTRDQLVERFGKKIGSEVPLDYTPPTITNSDQTEATNKVKKAAVYEIWCKDDRKVYWVNRSYPKSCLDIKDDWLGLAGFFPCPRPLTGTLAPDSYIPIPDYVYYQDQAEEIDELTSRIAILIYSLKMIGIYAGEAQALLQNLFQQPSGTLVPVPNMAQWSDKGGLKGIIEWVPIELVAATLTQCFEARRQLLDDIYQITGMSDIIRGMSDPRETATAQQMKGNWGSLRVRDKQKELARFSRDVLRLQAEIIAGQFGVSTLKAMTDVKLLDSQEQKQQIQASQQPMPAPPPMPGMQPQQPPPPPPIPPEVQQMMQRPTWEEVNGLLKNAALRGFRVDVETDSTIEPNEQEDKAARVEFITAIGQLMASSLPFLQSAPQAAPLVAESVKFLARGFRVGREMEDVIEGVFEQLAQNPPKELGQKAEGSDPMAGQVAQTELQQEQIKTTGALQLQQMKMQEAQQRMPLEQAQLQLEQQDQQLRLVALQRDPNPQAVSNG